MAERFKKSGRDRAANGPGGRADYRPKGEAAKSSTFATLKRTLTEFSEDDMTVWAAALTYFGLLSLFPALIAMVSIVGLVADPASMTRTLTEIVSNLGPSTAADTFAGPIESITADRGAAGILLIVGIATALWSASGYVGAFTKAANVIYETPEGRPFWKLKPLQILVTLVMILLLAAVLLALVLTGPVVDAVAGPLGIGSTAQTIWNIAKWPVMLAAVVVMFAVLFHASPNVKLPGFKWVTPGAVLAIVVWIVASALFAFYVANFGSYNKTYGTLGGVVGLLVWMWITNIAILLGMEFNAERERSREIAAGVPRAEREIQLEPRDEPKRQRTT
jgi:membrane protein